MNTPQLTTVALAALALLSAAVVATAAPVSDPMPDPMPTALNDEEGSADSATVDTQAKVQVDAAEISVSENLRAAVAHADRPAEDRARDAHRKPAEVLAFFGIEEGMRVAELMCGTGYYTEILSQVVGADGEVFAQNNAFVLKRFAEQPLTERIARLPLGNVVKLDQEAEEALPAADLDAAILVRFYHDFYWQECDRAGFNRAVFAALKPGGVFGVIDHHAEAGSGARDVQTLHRVDREMVVAEILAAGFLLEAETDLLADPTDTRDWNIFADDAAKRDQTDRFVLRFRKPLVGGAAAAVGGEPVVGEK